MKIVPIASRSTSAFSWSAEQCVSEFLADITTETVKPVKLAILWFSEDADGSLTPHTWKAQLDRAEEIALLEVAKLKAIDEWRK